MKERVLQFFRAVTARMNENEVEWVRNQLPVSAQELFFSMHVADQRHALNTAREIKRLYFALSASEQDGLQLDFLIRCALLHDVGRKKGMLDVWGKVLTVLLVYFFPKRSQRWSEGNSFIGHMLYIYFHHPSIGAEALRRIGMKEEAEVIARHHSAETANDDAALKLLRIADDRN
jgi:putative nucleotidyltransferase with HDIG domain